MSDSRNSRLSSEVEDWCNTANWSRRRRSAAETSGGAGGAWGLVVWIVFSWAKKEDMEGRRVGFLVEGVIECSTEGLLAVW